MKLRTLAATALALAALACSKSTPPAPQQQANEPAGPAGGPITLAITGDNGGEVAPCG